jgi:hypothetical protein
VYWSNDACWSNVPIDVWEFQIGGFPVLRKWLEDRKSDRLGRQLTLPEVRAFSFMARRIAALLLLGSDLDECHEMITSSELLSVE